MKKNIVSIIFLNRIIMAVQILLFISIITISYNQFVEMSHDTAKRYQSDIVGQLREYIKTTNYQVESLSEKLAYNEQIQKFLRSEDIISKHNAYGSVDAMQKYTIQDNQHISEIWIVNKDGEIKSFPDIQYNRNYSKLYEEIKRFNNRTDIKGGVYTDLFSDARRDEKFYAYLFPIYNSGGGEYNERLGTFALLLNVKNITNLVNQISLKESSVFIQDIHNNIIASSDDVKIESLFKNMKTASIEKNYIFYEEEIDHVNWKIISITAKRILNEEMKIISIIFIVSVLLVYFTFFMSSFLKHIINSQIKTIEKFVSSINRYDSNNRLHLKGLNEFEKISVSINDMLERMERISYENFKVQDKLHQVELARKEAQFLALQHQINPHFLYNTLNCMMGIGLSYDAYEIVDLTTGMCDIYRYCMQDNQIANIHEEIECVEHYLNIMNIRNTESVQFDYTNEKDLEIQIPIMTLQPLVENALLHGFKGRNFSECYIHISVSEKNGRINIKVEDNGQGMDKKNLEYWKNIQDKKINLGEESSKSLGMKNIHKRLNMSYGGASGLSVMKSDDTGTVLVLTIEQ